MKERICIGKDTAVRLGVWKETARKPKTRLSDNIKEICGLTMVETERKAQE